MKRQSQATPFLFGVLLVLLCLSGGCWNQLEVNNAAVVTAMGYDLVPDGRIKFSAQIITPQSTGSEDNGSSAEKPFLSFSSSDRTAVQAARNLTLTVSRSLLWAHAATYVIGDEMAREGMYLINDFLDRNRFIRRSSLLLIARDTEAEQVLQAESPVSQNPMLDLVSMLQLQDQQIGIYTPILVKEYLNALVTPGIDPILPAVAITEKDGKKILELRGMAVFHGDKMLGYLNEPEARGYRWLRIRPAVQGGMLTIASPRDGAPVLFEVLRANTSIKAMVTDGQITFKIKIQEEGNFYEQRGTDELLTPELIKSMEARIATKIKNEALAYLRLSQQLDCDCVGFGLILSRQYPDIWDQIGSQWSEIYPDVAFDFDVRAKIRRTGLTNQVLKLRF